MEGVGGEGGGGGLGGEVGGGEGVGYEGEDGREKEEEGLEEGRVHSERHSKCFSLAVWSAASAVRSAWPGPPWEYPTCKWALSLPGLALLS